MEEMENFVQQNEIDIAVLTIPKTSAVEVAERLVNNGVKAIWNFAHVVECPGGDSGGERAFIRQSDEAVL